MNREQHKQEARIRIIDGIRLAFSRLSDAVGYTDDDREAIREEMDREFRHIEKRFHLTPGTLSERQ
jgi:hypothetical protein